MKYLTLEAHCLDDEFETEISRDFGVSIVDRTDEPWSVTFAGPEQGLRDMYWVHWGEPNGESPDDFPGFDKEKP